MTQFLQPQSQQCLRQQLTSYMDGGRGTDCQEGVESQELCAVCIGLQGSASLHAVSPRSVGQAFIGHKGDRVESSAAENPFLYKKSTESETSTDTDCSELADEAIYSTADSLNQLHTVEEEEGRMQYEDQVAYWGCACIPCSFLARRQVQGQHAGCDGSLHAGVTKLRRRIHFQDDIGCFSCGQPGWICSGIVEELGICRQSNMVFQVCWMVVFRDPRGRKMVERLGGPAIEDSCTHEGQSTTGLDQYVRWLSQ